MDFFVSLAGSNLQNVHAPLPLPAHIAFCIIATALYVVQYKRKKINYYLYLLFAVDLTLVTQFSNEDYAILAVAVSEIILLVMAFLSSRKHKKALKQQEEKKKQEELMERGKRDGMSFSANSENP